jgi:hypothetical protein
MGLSSGFRAPCSWHPKSFAPGLVYEMHVGSGLAGDGLSGQAFVDGPCCVVFAAVCLCPATIFVEPQADGWNISSLGLAVIVCRDPLLEDVGGLRILPPFCVCCGRHDR